MSEKNPTEPEKAPDAPAVKKSAAVRMMTRFVGGPVASRGNKGKTQRTEDVAKPSQKPTAGGSSRVVRRGASKGR